MRTADLTYMAGLLEGEGCFSINRGCPAVILGMTDMDIVDRAAKTFGSTLRGPQRRSSSKKDVWITSIHGSKAVSWMLTLYSLLGSRRRGRIREVLSIWRKSKVSQRYRTHCPRGHEYNKENTRYYHGRRHCRKCAVVHVTTQRARSLKRSEANAYSSRCSDGSGQGLNESLVTRPFAGNPEYPQLPRVSGNNASGAGNQQERPRDVAGNPQRLNAEQAVA